MQILDSFTVRPTNYGSHHTRYPKIVIISDGFFNDCSPDSERKQQQCKKVWGFLKPFSKNIFQKFIKLYVFNSKFHCRQLSYWYQFWRCWLPWVYEYLSILFQLGRKWKWFVAFQKLVPIKTLNFINLVVVIICAIAELKTILNKPLPVATCLKAARSDKTSFVNPLKAVLCHS